MSSRRFRLHLQGLVCIGAIFLASCEDPGVSRWRKVCNDFEIVSGFPYAQQEWLTADVSSDEKKYFQFFGVDIGLPPTLPEQIVLRRTYAPWQVQLQYPNGTALVTGSYHTFGTGQEILAMNFGIASEHDMRELRQFGDLSFGSQLAWYLGTGQGAYECDANSRNRDTIKFFVESKLYPYVSLGEGSMAFVSAAGVTWYEDDLLVSLGVSSDRKTVVSGVPDEVLYEISLDQSDQLRSILVEVEEFLRGTGDDPGVLAEYLGSHGIALEYFIDGRQIFP